MSCGVVTSRSLARGRLSTQAPGQPPISAAVGADGRGKRAEGAGGSGEAGGGVAPSALPGAGSPFGRARRLLRGELSALPGLTHSASKKGELDGNVLTRIHARLRTE